MLSEIVAWHSNPASLENQIEILIKLSCKQTNLALIMSSMSTKKLADMTYMQNIPDNATLQLCCKFGESKWNEIHIEPSC